jgi:hypothetical protein
MFHSCGRYVYIVAVVDNRLGDISNIRRRKISILGDNGIRRDACTI